MKTYNSNFFVGILTLVIAVFVSACSSKKHEHDHDVKEKEVSVETPAPTTEADIKVFENVDPLIKTQINGFLADYTTLTNALTEDNADGAKATAKKLADDIAKFDMSKLVGDQMDFYHIQAAKLSAALKNIDESVDIEEIRMELSHISESIYALVKAYHANTSALYYNFCPMAKNSEGAYWLSGVKEIRNPYMGQRMLTCGHTTETLN